MCCNTKCDVYVDSSFFLVILMFIHAPSVFQCEVLMQASSKGSIWRVLLSLFWALQGSLLSWCFLQIKGGTSTSAELAREILLKCERPSFVLSDGIYKALEMLCSFFIKCNFSIVTSQLFVTFLICAVSLDLQM